MSKRKQDAQSIDSLSFDTKSSDRNRVQLTNLRQRLETQFIGTPFVDSAILDLDQQSEHLENNNHIYFEDDSMLTVVLSDALKGVDIFQTYPKFCQRLATYRE